MCGFIAQLVEHRTGIAEVTGSNPIEALIFSGFFFPVAYIGNINCDDHFSLSSTTAVQIRIISYLLYLLVSAHAVIGQFSGPYSPVRPAKI